MIQILIWAVAILTVVVGLMAILIANASTVPAEEKGKAQALGWGIAILAAVGAVTVFLAADEQASGVSNYATPTYSPGNPFSY